MGARASSQRRMPDVDEPGDEPLLPRQVSPANSYASIDATRQMNAFWVPPIKKDDFEKCHYRLLSVPKSHRPAMEWHAPRPFVIYDFLLSGIFLTIAIHLIRPFSEKVSWKTITSVILFQAGLVTAIMAIYAVFQSCGRRCLRWQDVVTVAALCVSLSLDHEPWQQDFPKSTWKLALGISLLEAIAIYFFARGLFLLPTHEDVIRMLTLEVTSMQTSLAIGLAELYFSKLEKVARVVERGGGRLPVSYSLEEKQIVTDEMLVPCIFVTLPRSVDWQQPMRCLRDEYIQSNRLLSCQVGEECDWLCVTGIPQGYLLDVAPTPLQVIIKDISSNTEFDNDEERTEQYEKEIRRFGQRLVWLLKRAGLEHHVKILEFDCDIMDYIPAACIDILAQEGYEIPHNDEQVDEAAAADVESPYQSR